MKIAIIDGVNQDIGLKILFPEADYYINNVEVNKNESLKKYNIVMKTDWENINDKNYDYLFIIISLYDSKKGTKFYKENIYNILQKELDIIDNNNFKKIFVFDNYDYEYDPNDIINNNKITLFFKRNYNKTKIYKKNVIPFPFIMFGEKSIIEKIEDNCIENTNNQNIIKNRIFFSGSLFTHIDEEINYVRNRHKIYSELITYIYNPGNLNYFNFIKAIKESKFSLDLNGVGDPNKRTFEILSQCSLMLSQFNDLKWPFEETFSEETIFRNEIEFIDKLMKLNANDELYKKCLQNQVNIYNKYFNIKWVKEYISKNI